MKEDANLTSTRYAAGFLLTIAMQFAAFQYGTYVAFSWDIIEPIAACTTLLDACAAYSFWIWTGKPWDLTSLRNHYFEKRKQKLMKKNNVDENRLDQLNKTRETIIKKLNSIWGASNNLINNNEE